MRRFGGTRCRPGPPPTPRSFFPGNGAISVAVGCCGILPAGGQRGPALCFPYRDQGAHPMPIASPEVYAEMLDRAKAGAFAYPAINVTSSQTLNAALQGFAEAGSDGIVQVSTGGAEYLSGPTVKDMVTGAVALAAFAHEVAKKYSVN